MICFENDEEKALVEKLKARFPTDDFTELVFPGHEKEVIFLRFLRARDSHLDKAEDMLRKTIHWRAEKNITSYLNWKPPKIISQDCIFRNTGLDFNGLPVIWIPIGKWDGRGLIDKGHKEDIIKYSYHIFESLSNVVRQSNVHQVGAIFGLEELTMWKIASVEVMQTLYGCLNDLARNYPECMKYIYVVNAPWVFSIVFNFIKPIMTARSLAKMKVFNSEKSKWLPGLLELMPKESVPAEYLDIDK